MPWDVKFHDTFAAEFVELPDEVKVEIAALTKVLQKHGPEYGRPRVDTLNGSKHANMKELRFDAADGVWRVAFAFDPKRSAILLVAGDKSGVNQKRFYKKLLTTADERFDGHLKELKQNEEKTKKKEKK